MTKSPDAFRTISEVAEWLGVQAHVLRFWESKFTQVKPVKRAGGRRYYRPGDMQLIGGIKKLLHDDGLTIKGVQKILREQGVAHVAELSQSLSENAADLIDDTGDTVVRFQGKPDDEDEVGTLFDVDLTTETEDAEPQSEEEDEEDAPEPVETAKEQDVEPSFLPSFLTRDAPPATISKDSDDAPPAVAGEPDRPRPRIVDAPDPAAHEDLPALPGALTQIARVRALTPDQRRQIAPLVAELQAWVDRMEHTARG